MPKQQTVAGAKGADPMAALVNLQHLQQRERIHSRHLVTTDATNSAEATWSGVTQAAYTLSEANAPGATSYSASNLLGRG